MKTIRTATFFFNLIWKANHAYLLCIVMLSMLNWIHTLMSVLLTKKLLDALEEGEFTGCIFIIAFMLSLFFLISVLEKIINAIQNIAQKDVHTKLHSFLGKHYVSLPLHLTRRHDNQELYEMAVKCINNSYAEQFVSYYLNILFNVGVIINLIYVLREFPGWMLVLFAIVIAVDVIVYLRQANLLYANYIDETPIERSLYYSRGRLMRTEYAKEIRLYGLKDYIADKTEQAIKAFYNQSSKTCELGLRKLLWTYLAEGLQFVGIYVFAIREYFSNTLMTIGDFSLILTSTTKFSQTVRSIAANGISLYKNLRYVEMLESFLKLSYSDESTGEFLSSGHHHFCFEHVSYRYDETENNVLNDINIEFNSDEKLSVVGENGAGKTTFIMLLLGFIKPTSGRILVDGRDINSISKDEYSRIFSPIFQDYRIYNASLQENVTLSLNYNEGSFLRSTQDVGLNVKKFPKKEKTNIGNIYDMDGIELSGGEAQKLALARAVYKPSAMFILDEPTASLDPRAECELYKNFERIAGNRGAIFISHRLASCKLCEKIFVFDKGKLIETGSHADLMEAKGKYYALFTAQSQIYFDNSEDAI